MSAKDKTVIVTGAAQGGLGAEVAIAFARAGARRIALLGRTEKTLQQTKDAIEQAFPDAAVFVAIADVSKAESVGTAAHHIRVNLGAWDVFANCAAHLPAHTTLAGADEDDWFKAFEINVKFSQLFAKHFLPKCRPEATYISVNAGACHVPATFLPQASAYSASKLALTKVDEYLAIENPSLRVFTVHPGIIETNMIRKAMQSTGRVPPPEFFDDASLPANFMVWLASPEADFLKSRYLWANWDVEEMIARKAEIEASPTLLRIIVGGWPFQ